MKLTRSPTWLARLALAATAGLTAMGVLVACSSDGATAAAPTPAPKCQTHADCKDKAAAFCDVGPGKCIAPPPAYEIGTGDGSPQSVTLAAIGSFGKTMQPVDLAFHPTREGEAWVLGYGDDSVRVGTGVLSDAPKWTRYYDPAARHFMYQPPALAMGEADTWGTCGDNDNTQNGGGDGTAPDFMGPALFSSDLSIFAKPATELGSHLDMLHHSPLCRGIEHEKANVYWVFNAKDRSLDKVNFNKDHGPGQDDHSDGEIYQYVRGQVQGAADRTPSHLALDRASGLLYVADTGNKRIVRLDTSKGTKGGELERKMEPLKAGAVMKGVNVEVVIDAGTLEKPSGIEVRGDLLFVTDAATSIFHAFTKDGTKVRSLATGLPPGSLAGFTFGPDNKIYFTDKLGGLVLRIDPR